jgi:hypothetical protein
MIVCDASVGNCVANKAADLCKENIEVYCSTMLKIMLYFSPLSLSGKYHMF